MSGSQLENAWLWVFLIVFVPIIQLYLLYLLHKVSAKNGAL